MCPLSRANIVKGIPLVVLRTSGNLITKAAYEETVKKDGVDPFNKYV